jgi:catechol 2,3-dioxygenase-like lactoylglutathione lyase family enzyme
MGESLERIAAITLFVSDTQRSKEFYARAFAADVVFEDANSVVFGFGDTVVNLLQRGPAVAELLAPVPAAEAGASFLLTVPVEDCDAACAELAERGVELVSGPVDRPWGIRTASFLDPDGYPWELAADLPR